MVVRNRSAWVLGVVALGSCQCPDEELNEPVCKFVVVPHDATGNDKPGTTGPLLFGEVRQGDSRERTITIDNAESNVPLTGLQLAFSQVNRDSYSIVGTVPEIAANASAIVTIRFSPVPIDSEVGNTLTVTHPAIESASCPTFTVTLRGRALPPLPPDAGQVDAGQDAGRPDSGPDAGPDAGPIFPRPDAGIPITDAGHFEARGGLQTARSQFGAALLPDGNILVVGGFDHVGQVTNAVEILDPHTGHSRLVTPLTDARARHSVTRLPSGKVVVFGGVSSGAGAVSDIVTSVEIYDPALQTWTRVSGSTRRADHHAVAVGNQVLVAWGLEQSAAGMPLTPAAGAVLVDEAGMVAAVNGDANAVAARVGAAMVDLEDGSVLFLGGVGATGTLRDDVVRFTGGALQTEAVTLLAPRAFAAAARFKDGPVVLAGGMGAAGPATGIERMEVLADPAQWMFEAVEAPLEPRLQAQAFRALDDVIVLTGGVDQVVTDGGVLARQDAELLVNLPSIGVLATSSATAPSIPRIHAATVAYDGGVAILGGSATHPRRSSRPDVDRFLPAATRFETMGLVGPGGAVSGAAPRRMFVAGGLDLSAGRATNRTRVYDLESEEFSEGPRLLVARVDAAAGVLSNGAILVIGGTSPVGDALAQVEMVRGDLSLSEAVGSLLTPRRLHTATVLPDDRVLVCGGVGAGNEPLDSCEVFDPVMQTFSAVSGRMVRGRYGHSATLLDSGKVFITGGNDPAIAPFRGDIFEPTTTRVRPTTGFPLASRRNHAAMLVGVGRVLLAGGETYVGERVPTATAEVWSEATEQYADLAPMDTARDGPAGLVFANGVSLVTGGAVSTGNDVSFPTRALARTELYDPAAGPSGTFRNVDVPLRFPRASTVGLSVLGAPVVAFGEGRHGWVGAGVEARVPLTGIEIWVEP